MKLSFPLAFSTLAVASMMADAFVVQRPSAARVCTLLSSSSNDSDVDVDLGLTPELEKMTAAFKSIGDEQLRYKQLLYMATNSPQANEFPESGKIPGNKVPGCLSTVYIDGTARYDESVSDYVVDFIGDSDGLLTKGLVALLIRGVSGNTAAAIQKVDPSFIKVAGIEQSLTPGRNNGFLNMLNVIKKKAVQLDAAAREGGVEVGSEASDSESDSDDDASSNDDMVGFVPDQGPKFNAIVKALQALKPTSLNLVDNSHMHAGHAGNDMDGESHFELSIVADAFEGLNLVKRHQLIYMMLGDIMPQIHALQIQSLTLEEAGLR